MNFNINDGIEQYYRSLIAQDLDDSLLYYHADDDNSDRIRWFNEGLKFASMIVRNGGGV